MTVARKNWPAPAAAPDLAEFRRHYPLTVANFGALGEREVWLRNIWAAGARWQEEQAAAADGAREAIVRSAPPAKLEVAGEFETIYAGGGLGLLHAAVAACCYKRRVLVFDPEVVGRAGRNWNVSADELRGLERAGLFTKEEIESVVVNRYEASFVKFHDRGSRVKAPPLWLRHVLDVAVDADKLLALAADKLRKLGPEGCLLLDGGRFVRAYVEPQRVSVELEDGRGRKSLYTARLFVDATGPASFVARQLNEGRALTHVCPTAGALARGFAQGAGAGHVDFKTGEILVSTEDASDHRQLIWEGFAGSQARDEYTTYLFFYDAIDSRADKSLLALFERYFERLPAYKRAGAHWRVLRPLFGYVPSAQPHGRKQRARTSDDRVLVVGAANPLALGGPGAHLRHLHRLTHLTELALAADLLDARALAELSAEGPRVAPVARLAEFLRPAPKSAPATVNETLNAVMAALQELDEHVRRELFQDRLSFQALKSLLSHTAQLYPRIFQRVREHLGARGTFWWLAAAAEAAFSERRTRAATAPRPETDEPPAAKFARYVALYKKGHGADDHV
ncbi:MAG: hypothetical protein ACJ74W_12145 [Pyrinomonadaceae bacterium]